MNETSANEAPQIAVFIGACWLFSSPFIAKRFSNHLNASVEDGDMIAVHDCLCDQSEMFTGWKRWKSDQTWPHLTSCIHIIKALIVDAIAVGSESTISSLVIHDVKISSVYRINRDYLSVWLRIPLSLYIDVVQIACTAAQHARLTRTWYANTRYHNSNGSIKVVVVELISPKPPPVDEAVRRHQVYTSTGTGGWRRTVWSTTISPNRRLIKIKDRSL